MIRAALSCDAGFISTFLEGYTETSMFLRANLAAHGIGSTGRHPHSCDVWLWEEDSRLRGVFALCADGTALMQMPGAEPALWDLLARELGGRHIAAMNGEAGQCAGARRALGHADATTILDRTEPLMVLSLADLHVPPADHHVLRRPHDNDVALLIEWRMAYNTDVLGIAPDAAGRSRAASHLAVLRQADALRVLEVEGQPSAMTAFNARLRDIVQVGGVFVPPEERGRGFGRSVVGLHLREAADTGVERGVLCAASDTAKRAYGSLGFSAVGSYHLLAFSHHQPVKTP